MAPNKVPQVSNLGRFKNAFGVITTGCLAPSGYCVAGCYNHSISLHRLVAWLFPLVGKPDSPSTLHVDHIDGDTLNNAWTNLQWLTPAEHAVKTAESTSYDSRGNAHAKPVLGRPENSTVHWQWFASVSDAERCTPAGQGGIHRCVRGDQGRAGGWEWRWADDSIQNETWRGVVRPDGVSCDWSVSDYGRVRSSHGCIGSGYRAPDGRCTVRVAGTKFQVHTLVALAWIGPPPHPDAEINHKDLCPWNNAPSNLEWCTHGDNMRHSHESDSERRTNADAVSIAVRALHKRTGEVIRVFASASAVQRTGIAKRSHVAACCNKKPKYNTAGGFRWEWVGQVSLPGEVWMDVSRDDVERVLWQGV